MRVGVSVCVLEVGWVVLGWLTWIGLDWHGLLDGRAGGEEGQWGRDLRLAGTGCCWAGLVSHALCRDLPGF